MHRRTSLFGAVLLLCTLSSVWSAANNNKDHKGLRGLEGTTLKCRVMYVGTEMLNPVDNGEEYMCMPIVGDVVSEFAYPMTLPSSFLDEYADKLFASDRDILIEGGELMDEEYINIPSNSLIQLVFDSRVVTVAEKYVTRKMLIVRVSTLDKQPTLNAAQLSVKTFDLETLTMRSQYLACSHGKLTFNPYVPAANSLANGASITGGVLEVLLPMNVTGKSRISLTNAAIAATQAALGTTLADVVDNVIICHPPGSLGEWVAYAFPNNVVSVYNDVWCGYVSSTMHEVGHNLGFLHSNQGGDYNDKTGYMGFSYSLAGWPAVCFNGHKNWLSGWFSDRVLEVDPADGVYRGKLATFVDYHLTSPGENVVIKVGDLYMQYNRAKGMNFETREMQNQVTIVEDRVTGSELLAGIDGRFFNTTLYSQDDYGANNETLFIAVCSTHLGDDFTTPDMMYVSVGLNVLDCYAPATSAPTESPAPSPTPSMTPVSAPSESPAPSPSPSMSPSSPTTRPSPSPSRNPSRSHAPSSTPKTQSPSWIVPDRGGVCDDNVFGTFHVGEALGLRNCQWLQETPQLQELLCVPGFPAYEMCAETCGKCSDECEDDDDAVFSYNSSYTNCSLIREEDPSTWKAICGVRYGAVDHCQETCNSCPSAIDNYESCDDSQEQTYNVDGVGSRRCSWLAQPLQFGYRTELCKPENPIFHLCAETCGKCFDKCDDDPTATFMYNANDGRDCQWLSTKPLQWEAACGNREDIREACKETCENCG